jgi:hypothetical protein
MTQAAQAGVHLIDGLGSPAKPAAEPPLPAAEPAGAAAAQAAPPLDVGAQVELAWARLSPADQRALVAQLARTKTPVAPLLYQRAAGAGRLDLAADAASLPQPLRGLATGRQWPGDAAVRQQAFERARAFVLALQEAGGRLVVASGANGDDWPLPGLGVHRELAWLVEAGLSPLEALRAATVVAAETLGERQAARIAAGAPADFFAVKGDPLTDITALASITLIVRGGEVLDRDALLAQAGRAGRGR